MQVVAGIGLIYDVVGAVVDSAVDEVDIVVVSVVVAETKWLRSQAVLCNEISLSCSPSLPKVPKTLALRCAHPVHGYS